MLRYLSVMFAIVILVSAGCGRHPTWKYDGKFYNAIATADRMLIIDAGFDCYGGDSKAKTPFDVSKPQAKTLFEISKPEEIKQFAEHLEFQKGQKLGGCPCNGYPRVDWYQGERRLATVSIQHGQAIRWKGFQADAKLTSTSSQWLVQWLTDHHVDSAKMK
jgi:hypothetical protein